MARTRTPLWLVNPSRFAPLKRARARFALGLLAAFLLLCLSALSVAGPPPVSHQQPNRAEDQADVILYENIVAGLRGGDGYYAVTAAALRAGNYPLKPFVTFRLPTLAVVQGALPQSVTLLLLLTLVASVMVAWFIRLRPVFIRPPPLVIALVLLTGGLMAFVQPALVPFHEIWAGLLIALSLALRRPGRWVEAAAFGLIAMLIRETAALFVMMMAGMAFIEGYRREALGWAVTLGVLGVAVAAHAHAVAQVVGPLDPVSPGWAGMLGFGFFVKTMSISTALNLAPAWVAAPLVGLSLFGWASWGDPLGRRALMMFAAYAVLLSLFGRPDTFYWGLLVAPTILIGLTFAPDGLRDLIVSALDSRRITVTRSIR